jgi:class 3 adenylate cyclase
MSAASLRHEMRKVVTVVFADVVGSTALGERVDPETLRWAMQRWFGRMREVVERHGGVVENYIGDAVMAVFGIPVAHEDDALRAARAATEMREEVAGL